MQIQRSVAGYRKAPRYPTDSRISRPTAKGFDFLAERTTSFYLPQYQAIKQKHSIEAMFKTPELAAEITCQPIDILGVPQSIKAIQTLLLCFLFSYS